jgi:XRE family aerobic/anaerobic benzoate catabolism transcriptional regulator
MDRSRNDAQAALAHTVRELRRRLRWSRKELARRTKISERFLADIESGRANPSLQRLCELAAALDTSPQALITTRAAGDGATARTCIALLGLRGAGKSTVGKLLAGRLGAPFVELDERIEAAAGMRLAEIFELHGEAFYREKEMEVLRELLERADSFVLATGGGLVTNPEAWTFLRSRAHTVWLRAAPEDHWNRVVNQGDTRPMADHEHAFARLCALLAERDPLYGQAEVTVVTTGRPARKIAAELATRYAQLHDRRQRNNKVARRAR